MLMYSNPNDQKNMTNLFNFLTSPNIGIKVIDPTNANAQVGYKSANFNDDPLLNMLCRQRFLNDEVIKYICMKIKQFTSTHVRNPFQVNQYNSNSSRPRNNQSSQHISSPNKLHKLFNTGRMIMSGSTTPLISPLPIFSMNGNDQPFNNNNNGNKRTLIIIHNIPCDSIGFHVLLGVLKIHIQSCIVFGTNGTKFIGNWFPFKKGMTLFPPPPNLLNNKYNTDVLNGIKKLLLSQKSLSSLFNKNPHWALSKNMQYIFYNKMEWTNVMMNHLKNMFFVSFLQPIDVSKIRQAPMIRQAPTILKTPMIRQTKKYIITPLKSEKKKALLFARRKEQGGGIFAWSIGEMRLIKFINVSERICKLVSGSFIILIGILDYIPSGDIFTFYITGCTGIHLYKRGLLHEFLKFGFDTLPSYFKDQYTEQGVEYFDNGGEENFHNNSKQFGIQKSGGLHLFFPKFFNTQNEASSLLGIVNIKGDGYRYNMKLMGVKKI